MKASTHLARTGRDIVSGELSATNNVLGESDVHHELVAVVQTGELDRIVLLLVVEASESLPLNLVRTSALVSRHDCWGSPSAEGPFAKRWCPFVVARVYMRDTNSGREVSETRG